MTAGSGVLASGSPKRQPWTDWYWHKPYLKATDEPDMYWLNRTDKGLIAWTMNSRQPVEEMGGWWLGPLAPPD